MQMNRKSSFAICLTAALLVAVTSLILLQNSKTGHLVAALLRGHSAQRTSRAGIRPSASQDFLFDPVLVYSSFLGGPSYSDGLGEIVQFASLTYADSTGNLYLTGGTVFKTFPTTPGVVQPTLGSSGSFLAKVDPTGHHLVFSTYLPFHAPVSAMTVDAAGNIYLAGGSTDSTIPIPSGLTPYRTSGSLGIVKLNPTATTVLAATYLGGSGADRVGGIALDSSNNLYITGRTLSNDFPTSASPLQASLGTSGRNGFVTVLNSSLTAAVYSTYLGGNSFVETGSGHSIAVDASKDAYVTGSASAGFPGTNGSSAQASCSNDCVFVAKLNPTGSAIAYATYLGTDASGRSIAVDASQNIYVSGIVNENGFNELNPVSTFPSCNANLNEGENFASKIAASGALAFSTCFPGSSSGNSALDSSGNMYVFGAGFSSLPLTHPIQSHDVGPYIVGINPNSSSVVFASFLWRRSGHQRHRG